MAYAGSPVGSLNGCCAAALAQVWKSRRFVYYAYSSPLAGAESTFGRDTQMLTCTLFSSYSVALYNGKLKTLACSSYDLQHCNAFDLCALRIRKKCLSEQLYFINYTVRSKAI